MNDELRQQRLPGNAPLELNGVNDVLQVLEGWVDVFAVMPPEDGRRMHLYRAEVGDCLFGVRGKKNAAVRLVAIGMPETTVSRIDRQVFQERMASVEQVGQVVPYVERWLRGLARGLMRETPAPSEAELLAPGVQQTCAAGKAIASQRQVLWVSGEGSLLFLGQEALRVERPDGFPIAAPIWLLVRKEARLRADTTARMIPDPRLWNGMDRFHQLILEFARLAIQNFDSARRQKVCFRETRDHLATHEALSSLRAVIELDETDFVGPQEHDPLLAACRLVGKQLAIAVRRPLSSLERVRRSETLDLSRSLASLRSRQSADPQHLEAEAVEAIARASRFQARRVTLSDDWWRQDQGPLLGFRRDDRRPLALLPKSPGQYRQVDVTTGRRRPVSATEAKEIDRTAYQFHRPFPRERLTPWRLFRFGLVGTTEDWLMVFVFGLIGALLSLFPPIATGWLFDRVIPGAERHNLWILLAAFLAASLAATLFRLVRNVALMRAEMRMSADIETGLWDRLLNLPPTFFRAFSVGDLESRASGLGSLRFLLVDVALTTILNSTFSFVYLALLFYYDRRLALVGLFMFAIVVCATCFAGYWQLPYQRKAQQLRGRIAGIVFQLVHSLPRIRVASAENRALVHWATEFRKLRELEFRVRRISNLLSAFSEAAPLLSLAALLAVVTWFPREGLTLGSFLAFSVAFARLLSSGLAMSSTIGSLIEIVPIYERTRPILEAFPEADSSKQVVTDLRGDIEVSQVSFRYDPNGPWILDDVSLRIRPGQFVALVGPSGAGKSTLLRLLLGFDQPTSGGIFFDREELIELDLPSLRRHIGVVLQETRPLPGTILENIVGSTRLSEKEAWEAAELVGLAEEIRQLPDGMQTLLGEGSGSLTRGQIQRLMIARALVARPRVLFFDEATSAQDNDTQARVMRALSELNATRVVIAHRLSTVRDADRIFVFDGGRIVQSGTFDELLAEDGLFAELAREQLL